MRAESPSTPCDSPTPSADVVGRGEFPILLGGDCSILLGSTLALRRRGRYGLLFIDGHADFYQPEANPNGEAASMDLAFATGHGPELLTNLEGLRPLVRDEDVVAFGFRDAEEQRRVRQPAAAAADARARSERSAPARRRARRAARCRTSHGGRAPDARLLHSPRRRRRQRRSDARRRLSNARRLELGRAAHSARSRARAQDAQSASRSRSTTPRSMQTVPAAASWRGR